MTHSYVRSATCVRQGGVRTRTRAFSLCDARHRYDAGMRERARLAGGVLEIDSGPAGTTVSVCIPVTTAYQGMRRA